MQIAILRERRPYESRVAATPDTVKKYKALGYDVLVERGAGVRAACLDDSYVAAGARIAATPAEALQSADVVLTVQRPLRADEGEDIVGLLKPGVLLVGMLNPYAATQDLALYAERNVVALAMELVPRITRAQSMDVLSSQSNLAGYKAVLEAAAHFGRVFPMMVTAAGTLAPARVFVMGAGVAGLQAIATAKRLGAIVSATDVRAVAREQVQSLGATFVMVESDETAKAETTGGYAKEMSADYQKRQAELVASTIQKQDIVICTALIPGRAAPRLVTEDMVRSMKPGSVVVDLAVEQGGNCALSRAGEVVQAHGVTILGPRNIPSFLPIDASALYARNVLALVTLLSAPAGGTLSVPWDDAIVQDMTLTRGGALVHPQFQTDVRP